MTTRRRWCQAGLGWMACPGLASPARAVPLRAVGSQFARIFEGAEGQAPRGLAVDLLGQLFGDSVRCEWLPWSRAQLMLEQGDADILIGPYRTPEREARMLFSVRAFYSDAMVWYARRGEEARWKGEFADLARTPVAAMRGWAYGSRFERMKTVMSQLTWVHNVDAGLQMLMKRRVELFAANDRNCRPVLQRLRLEGAVARCSPPLDVLHGHMAFARSAAGETLSQRYDQAFEHWLRTPPAADLYRLWGVDRPATPP
ncbi:ABC transporter substrate-binding protein [Roseateles sp.]|uniref:substrate-binding periplasmic protein n=1 Tax=Roseateles sp. TaxID=1971397 RepID=UPI0025FADF63|nr:transporter substrate-binding domain-containing protein [Roseateles sp.]MBV8033466.1 transporter substrate-binding domain-containing protein [Roseateles sp.]